MNTVIAILMTILLQYLIGKITLRTLSKYYGKKCNYNCKQCKMWSCTNETKYENYNIIPYENYKKYCGKEKNV